MPENVSCAYCHGVKLSGSTAWIHATRFAAGSAGEGEEIRYDFCDGGCKKAWLDRGDHGLVGRIASELYEMDHNDCPLRCENCGKTMAEHDKLAHCWPTHSDGSKEAS